MLFNNEEWGGDTDWEIEDEEKTPNNTYMEISASFFWGASLVAQTVKNPSAVWETWVGKIPMEEGMATLSSVLAWRIPRTEEPGGLQSIGLHRIWHD